MSALEPGLYRATVRGVADVTVTVVGDGCGYVTKEINGCLAHLLKDITDARPLIVLDLSVFISDAQLLADLRAPHVWDLNQIADQIEAQTRIPEPGLWGVVEAAASTNGGTGGERVRWARYPEGWCGVVYCERPWDDLVDPTLIRDGIES